MRALEVSADSRLSTILIRMTWPTATAILALLLVFEPAVYGLAREKGLLGWGAHPGARIVVIVLASTAFVFWNERDSPYTPDRRRAAWASLLLVAAAVLHDVVPIGWTDLGFGAESRSLVAAGAIIAIECIVAKMKGTLVAAKVGFCLAGAFILAVYVFNAYNQYESMGFFAGGSVV